MPRRQNRREITQAYKPRGASSRKNEERRRKRQHDIDRLKKEGRWNGGHEN